MTDEVQDKKTGEKPSTISSRMTALDMAIQCSGGTTGNSGATSVINMAAAFESYLAQGKAPEKSWFDRNGPESMIG